MIQLLQLREFVNEDGKNIKFDKIIEGVRHPDSVIELFRDIEKFTSQIPKKERWNCFYTLANCTDKKREFQSLSVMYFDIDNIDKERRDLYLPLILRILGVDYDKTGIVSSGNGLHFIIALNTPIVDKKFFDNTREHYKAICSAINAGLKEADLPGGTDVSVFDARRFFRLPLTENRKPNKPVSQAELIQRVIVPVSFDITIASGIPVVAKEDQLDPAYFKKFPRVDNEAIFSGCSFLGKAKADPCSLDEPELYAALSIVGRMTNGREVAMNVFAPRFGVRRHGGTPEDLESKLEQATNASGPRMCKSIAQFHKGCAKCPHFKNASSPIMIQGANAIKTETTGFYDMVFDPETNKMKRGKPNFEDLRKYFDREFAYRAHDKIIWIWTGTHYKEMTNEEVKSYCQSKFDPPANAAMRGEFLDLVQVTNLVTQESWNDSTFGKINLLNGVLDLETGDLSPHSKEYGFKYCLPYAFDKKAKAPRFLQFLDDVTQGNEVLKNTLIEFGGYAISGSRCKYDKALVLEGEGKNGKSTFIKVLTSLVGKNSYSSLSFKELETTERRSALDGVLFNITEETPNKLNDTTSFKNLTSGGDIQLRKLYKNSYSIQNKAKLIFSCNEMPITHDTSEGFFRRFLIVPFHAKFTKADGNLDLTLSEKLKEELPGVLNIFLDGYRRLEANKGFSKGDEDDKEIEAYKEAVDPLRMWVKERLHVEKFDSDMYTTATDLFSSFRTWCEANGFDPRVKNAVSIGIQLRRYIPDIIKRRTSVRIDGFVQRRLQGIQVKPGDF